MAQQEESKLKHDICVYLRLKKIFFWTPRTSGIWNKERRVFMRLNGIGDRVGVADIIGIHNKMFFAIEVKTKTGKITENQLSFLEDVNANGGVGFVARSVEDVQRGLWL